MLRSSKRLTKRQPAEKSCDTFQEKLRLSMSSHAYLPLKLIWFKRMTCKGIKS